MKQSSYGVLIGLRYVMYRIFKTAAYNNLSKFIKQARVVVPVRHRIAYPQTVISYH